MLPTIVGILGTVLIWRLCHLAPLAWSAGVWIIILYVLTQRARIQTKHALLLCTLSLVFAIGAAEALLWTMDYLGATQAERDQVDEEHFNDPKTGFVAFLSKGGPLYARPTSAGTVEHITKFHHTLVYDAHYTLDENGFRMAPLAKTDGVADCVILLGNSYTFGWGLNDSETTKYQLASQSDVSRHIANLSSPGYSAAQALAEIQSGMVSKLSKCNPGQTIYAVLDVLPISETWLISANGPRYILSNSGTVARKGDLGQDDFILDDSVHIQSWAFSILRNVKLYQRTLGGERRPTDFDTKRLVAVIVATKFELQKLYPRLHFMVTVWGDPIYVSDVGTMLSKKRKLVAALTLQDIVARDIGDILPNYNTDRAKYTLKHEFHPTAGADRMYAAYLLQHFIGISGAGTK